MVAFHARTGRGGRHSSANQLASDRKSSYDMPMVSSLLFVDLKTTHQASHSPPSSPHIHLPATQCVSHSSPSNLSASLTTPFSFLTNGLLPTSLSCQNHSQPTPPIPPAKPFITQPSCTLYSSIL